MIPDLLADKKKRKSQKSFEELREAFVVLRVIYK